MRIVVAGGGLIGARHIAHVADHPKFDLVGVIDPDPKVRAAAPVASFVSIEAVDVPVDAIIIATPTDLHAANAEAAAKRGWHMLIEKPVAGTLEQAERVVAAVERAGVTALVGHHRRYHPKVQALKTALDAGRIGSTVLASMIWAVRKPDEYFDVPWRAGRAGSPIMINLVHELDLLRFLFGDVIHVSGFGSGVLRGQGRIESGGVTLGFANGPVATLAFADTSPSPWGFEAGTGENPNIGTTNQDMLWITGTKGSISFPSMTLWEGAEDWSQATQPNKMAIAEGVPLVAQLEHFADVVAGRATPLIDARDAAKTLAVTLQIEAVLMGGQGQ
ncbi:oxidoreductase [Rhodobacterales bacterium 56_14_T64]|nr:oxidoreductase [Rhodobacterales bacterium 56_14_T64]